MGLRFLVSPLVISLAVVARASPARAQAAPLPATVEAPPATELPILPAESVQLPNGLHVLLAPDPQARLVSVVVSYAAGAADDPDGRRGLAHLAEHFVCRRTRHVRNPDRVLEGAGAVGFNAMTNLDTTNFFETVPPERLETVLWLESDRMGFPTTDLDEQTVREERAVVANEDRDRTVDGALWAVRTFADEDLYPGWHPYSAWADGAADLDQIGVDDVRAFVRTWYGPDNATLSIAGRFDRDATLASIERYFGPLRPASPPARPALPASDSPNVILVVKAAVGANQIVVEWRTPEFGTADDAALDMAAVMLAGPGNTRFERALVAPHLATSVQAHQRSERRESIFSVVATAAPGVNPGLLVDRMQDAIDDLARHVTVVEVDRARTLWRSEALSRVETTWGRAEQLVTLASRGKRPGPGFDWGFGTYEGIRTGDVRRAASAWLSPAHRVAVAIFADPSAPRTGRLVGRKQLGP